MNPDLSPDVRKKLYIYGAGFFDVVKLVDAINRQQPTWAIQGFLDDAPERQGTQLHGIPILGGRELLPDLAAEDGAYVCHNINGTRQAAERVADLLRRLGCRVPSLVHPAVDASYVTMGEGCFVPEGCILGADVHLGDFVTLRYGAVISHEVDIGDLVLVGPGATIGSRARVHRGALIGAGATVITGQTVAAGAVVGAGAVVAQPVPEGKTVAGVPARILQEPS